MTDFQAHEDPQKASKKNIQRFKTEICSFYPYQGAILAFLDQAQRGPD
jgi:hypothetical protein